MRRLDDDAIILVRQFRYPTFEKGPGWIVELPAGMVEGGEDPEHSIRRELIEEVGYEPSHLEFVGDFYVSPGGSSERLFLYYVEVSEATRVASGGGLSDEGEDIEIVEVALENLVNQLRRGELKDAKTIIGAQWLMVRSASL